MLKKSEEFRQPQHEQIMKTKPWLKTKGPITIEGKSISKMNALRVSPELHALLKEYNMLMQQQTVFSHLLLKL